jgi:hypothetical protein
MSCCKHKVSVDQESSVAQDYPLEELSPRAFEQMTVALAQEVIGPGVEAFGSGPDGGREATYRGIVRWSRVADLGEDEWNGYVVFQAKQREYSAEPGANAKWLIDEVGKELDRWVDPLSKRGEVPKYVVFVTNARLSSVAGTGGIDAINAYVARRLHDKGIDGKGNSLYSLGMRGWKVWHRDQLNGLLSGAMSVRLAFKSLLTHGDLTAMIQASAGALSPEDFRPFLLEHGESALAVERWVRFNETGDTQRHSIEEVFIDLPLRPGPGGGTNISNTTTVIEALLTLSESVLRPGFPGCPPLRHVVLAGQAGGGKSTVSRFFAQALRSNFLSEEHLGRGAAEVRAGTTAAFSRLGLRKPVNRRWPFRIDLAEYADALGPDGQITIVTWIARKISERGGIAVGGHTINRWIQHWPSAIILDGLDEVTVPEVRQRLLDELTVFLDEQEKVSSDLLVVITTRPMSESERLDPERFTQLDLALLDRRTALAYGDLVIRRRLQDEPDRLSQLQKRFTRHADDAAMLHIMKTPLQVVITTVILERSASLPGDRYRLFWQYFEAIFAREVGKPTTLAPLLTQYERVVYDIHELVGVALQVSSETERDARALMSREQLEELIRGRLHDLEHAPGRTLDHLVERLVAATTQRLVLLVPGEDDNISFEIRSLQELMAGRAVSAVGDDDLRHNLRATARNPHWRNTWVFAVGRVFAEQGDYRRDLAVDVVESIDLAPEGAGWLSAIGPQLAGVLLEDGLAASTPRWQRRLVDVALRVLAGPVPQDLRTVATGLASSARGDANLRTHIRNALRAAVHGTPSSRHSGIAIADNDVYGPIGIASDSDFGFPETVGAERSLRSLGEFVRPHLSEVRPDASAKTQLNRALDDLDNIEVYVDASGHPSGAGVHWKGDLEVVRDALADPDCSRLLADLFGCLDPITDWRCAPLLAHALDLPESREPVGDALRGVSVGN